MKSPVKIPAIVILLVGMTIFFPSCKKEMDYPIKTATDSSAPPIVLTFGVSGVTSTTVSVQGAVLSDGGATVYDRGFCWSTSENPTTANSIAHEGAGTGNFETTINELIPDWKYYVRAFATNSAGVSYGKEVSFTTNENNSTTTGPVIITSSKAKITTAAISEITSTSAVSGGDITDDGGSEITYRGISWSTIPDAYIYSDDVTIVPAGSGTGPFVCNMSGLNPETTYYVRSYAVNSMGMAIGPQISFTTSGAGKVSQIIFNTGLTYGKISDIDGNTYKTIPIGDQVWMAENLKTTKFNDGTPITNVTGNFTWVGLRTPGYCWYNNDEVTYKDTYGALYNWYAVNKGNLCPAGFHVPSNDEWDTMISYLGGEIASAAKVMEAGNSHWSNSIPGANNESGFTALPGGFRSISNDFFDFGSIGIFGVWWTASPYTPPIDALAAQLPGLNNVTGQLDFEAGYAASRVGGASVRCIKN